VSGSIEPNQFALVRERFGDYMVPCILVQADTASVISQQRAFFGDAAQRGILYHTTPAYVDSLNPYGRQYKRETLRPFTAHNQKMGVNWSVPRKMYEPIRPESTFPKTGYDSLLEKAAQFMPIMAEHWTKVRAMMQKNKVATENLKGYVPPPKVVAANYVARGSHYDADDDDFSDTLSVSTHRSRAG